MNANKTEYMCFKLEGPPSTLSGEYLKLVDKFAYLGSSVSSTESDVDIYLVERWPAINLLSIVWKFNLSDKIKWDIFRALVDLVWFG